MDISTNEGLFSFSDILSRMKRKFEIIHSIWTEEKSYEIKFRTELDKHTTEYDYLCDEWVDKFSEITNTVWVKKTSNTGPKVIFRKQYQCWTHGGKAVQKELLFDARKCKGTIDIKVMSDIKPASKKKNKFCRLGLNVVVKINFSHLHKVNTSEPLSFFVHLCKPQPEPPQKLPSANEKLPQLVANMVQKALNSSQGRIENSTQMKVTLTLNNNAPQTVLNCEKGREMKSQRDSVKAPVSQAISAISEPIQNEDTFISEELQMNSIPNLHLVQNIPLQNLAGVKLEVQPSLEQYAQIVVSNTSMNESLLMCQPLLFENVQALPHFVQLNSHSLCNQNQFLQ